MGGGQVDVDRYYDRLFEDLANVPVHVEHLPEIGDATVQDDTPQAPATPITPDTPANPSG